MSTGLYVYHEDTEVVGVLQLTDRGEKIVTQAQLAGGTNIVFVVPRIGPDNKLHSTRLVYARELIPLYEKYRGDHAGIAEAAPV